MTSRDREISVDAENMSQYQNQMGTTSTNGYDRNYGPPNEPQLGHFSPNFHNVPSFSGKLLAPSSGHLWF